MKTKIATSDRGSSQREDRSVRVDRPMPRPMIADKGPNGAAIEQLSETLHARLAGLERQLAGVLVLLSQPRTTRQPDLLDPCEDTDAAVYCLGSFRFEVAGARVEGWRSGKARALFQYLVCHRDRPIPRHTLIEALWPNPDAVASGTSLKVAVHTLRQLLSQLGAVSSAVTIRAQGSSYQLSAPHLWLDVEEFERCCSIGRRLAAQDKLPEALALYARAAELYKGDFLEDVWEEWAMFRREALKDQYLSILACLARAALEEGDYHGCIMRCQQILEKDCCREDTYRMLMLCHARLGQRSRVRSWYEYCVRTLHAELDVAPEPETEQLYRLALTGKA